MTYAIPAEVLTEEEKEVLDAMFKRLCGFDEITRTSRTIAVRFE